MSEEKPIEVKEEIVEVKDEESIVLQEEDDEDRFTRNVHEEYARHLMNDLIYLNGQVQMLEERLKEEMKPLRSRLNKLGKKKAFIIECTKRLEKSITYKKDLHDVILEAGEFLKHPWN